MAIKGDNFHHINRNLSLILESIAKSRKTIMEEKISLSIEKLNKAIIDYCELRKALNDSQR